MRTIHTITIAVCAVAVSPLQTVGACVDWSLGTVVPTSTISPSCGAYSMLWDLSTLFVSFETECPGGTAPGLSCYDVSDPALPDSLGTAFPDLYEPWNMYLADEHVFLDGISKVHVFDVTDVTNPVFGAEIFPVTGTSHRDMTLEGDLLLQRCAALGGLPQHYRLYDVTTPVSPVLLGSFDPVAFFRNGVVPTIGGGYAYVVESDDVLRIWDVTVPANPVARGSVSVPPGTSGGVLDEHLGHIYFMSVSTGEIVAIDVNDPDNPVSSPVATLSNLRSLAAAEGILYVTGDSIWAFSLADPMAPVLLGQVDLGFRTAGVAIGPEHITVFRNGPYGEVYILPQACDLPTAAPTVGGALGSAFRIRSAGKNPSDGSVSLDVRGPDHRAVTVDIMDSAGRLVARLHDGPLSGSHRIVWSGADSRGRPVASGVYFARAKDVSSGESAVHKVVVRRR